MADSIPTQLENELNYNKVDAELHYKLPATSDNVLQRRSMSIAPSSGGGSYTAGDSTAIRFKLRSGDFIDPQSIHMTCDYLQTVATTDNVVPVNGMGCLIRELRIRSGTGSMIETIREAGLLNDILQNYSMSKTHLETVHSITGGGATNAEKMGGLVVSSAVVTNKLCFHLPSGFLHSCGKYLDTGALKGLVIELEFYPSNVAFKSNATVSYTISNPQIHYDELKVSGAYMKAYQQALVNGMNIGYSTYTHSSSSGGDSVRISRSVSRLKDVISIVRTTSSVNALASQSIGASKAYTDAVRWNYQIGSESYPVSQVQSGSQAYREALKVFARAKDAYCGNITKANFLADKAIIAVDCELSQGGAFSGVKTTQNPDILLISSNLMSSTDTCDTWLHHERVLRFTNGAVEVLE